MAIYIASNVRCVTGGQFRPVGQNIQLVWRTFPMTLELQPPESADSARNGPGVGDRGIRDHHSARFAPGKSNRRSSLFVSFPTSPHYPEGVLIPGPPLQDISAGIKQRWPFPFKRHDHEPEPNEGRWGMNRVSSRLNSTASIWRLRVGSSWIPRAQWPNRHLDHNGHCLPLTLLHSRYP